MNKLQKETYNLIKDHFTEKYKTSKWDKYNYTSGYLQALKDTKQLTSKQASEIEDTIFLELLEMEIRG